jgi:eukaryotic-like serine/threonine-protein kinase
MSEPRRGSSPLRPPGANALEPSPEAFLQAIRRSQLMSIDAINAASAGAPADVRANARKLAEHFIAIGELTHYQTEKLLGGRWRGLVVGDYHILAPLGRGGMGTVYLAKSLAKPATPPDPLFPLVALKVLPPKRAREEAKTLLRFRREMELGKPLDHPNITRTLDAGEHHGVHYIAMEYVPGLSLKQLISRDGPLPVGEAARLFADAAAGLEHAHQKGLIHRDLKPSNIMVTPEGQAKVLDLGMAMLMNEALPEDPAIVGGEGYILGTMDYIAPEQTTDATNVGPHSDVYSLGCSIYHTVCGMPPFPGGTSKQKMQWHRTEPAPAPHSINPAVPPDFSRLIGRCMAKDPRDRPESAEALRGLLLRWATERTPPGDSPRHTDRDVVSEVDTRQLDPSLWDEIPVAELVGEGIPLPPKPPRTREPFEEDGDTGEHDGDARTWLIVGIGAMAAIAGLAALAVVLALLRRL